VVACTAASGCGPDDTLHPIATECPAVSTADTVTEADGVLLLHAETWNAATPPRSFARFRVDGAEGSVIEPGEESLGVALVRVWSRGGHLVADWCRVP
jgi:hypothetical protein